LASDHFLESDYGPFLDSTSHDDRIALQARRRSTDERENLIRQAAEFYDGEAFYHLMNRRKSWREVTLERAGFIERQPGVPRSIEVGQIRALLGREGFC